MPAMMPRTGLEILKRSHITFEVADGYKENYPFIPLYIANADLQEYYEGVSASE
jgi:hypothetical protein